MSIHKRTDTTRSPWIVRWREGGKQRSRGFRTRKAAVAFEAEVVRRSELGAHAPAPASAETIGDWIERWQEIAGPTWAATTRRQRRDVLRGWITPNLGDVRLRDFGPAEARAFRTGLVAAGATPTTANSVMRVLSAALGAAADDGLIPANPCAGLRAVKTATVRPRAITPRDVEAIRARLAAPDDRLIVSLIAYAGLRPGEVCGLSWGQVREDVLVIDRSAQLGEIVSTKTGRTRTVALIPLLRDELEAYGRRRDDDLVVPNRQRGGIRNWHNWGQRVFKPAAKAAGVACVPYDLRHSFASLLIHEGRSIGYVSAQMGHASQTLTLQHYSHFFDEAAVRTRASLSELAEAARKDSAERSSP